MSFARAAAARAAAARAAARAAYVAKIEQDARDAFTPLVMSENNKSYTPPDEWRTTMGPEELVAGIDKAIEEEKRDDAATGGGGGGGDGKLPSPRFRVARTFSMSAPAAAAPSAKTQQLHPHCIHFTLYRSARGVVHLWVDYLFRCGAYSGGALLRMLDAFAKKVGARSVRLLDAAQILPRLQPQLGLRLSEMWLLATGGEKTYYMQFGMASEDDGEDETAERVRVTKAMLGQQPFSVVAKKLLGARRRTLAKKRLGERRQAEKAKHPPPPPPPPSSSPSSPPLSPPSPPSSPLDYAATRDRTDELEEALLGAAAPTAVAARKFFAERQMSLETSTVPVLFAELIASRHLHQAAHQQQEAEPESLGQLFLWTRAALELFFPREKKWRPPGVAAPTTSSYIRRFSPPPRPPRSTMIGEVDDDDVQSFTPDSSPSDAGADVMADHKRRRRVTAADVLRFLGDDTDDGAPPPPPPPPKRRRIEGGTRTRVRRRCRRTKTARRVIRGTVGVRGDARKRRRRTATSRANRPRAA